MKSRAQINHENYLKHREARKNKAKQRMRDLRGGWREAIAAWDREFALPTDSVIDAACLSQWSVLAAYTEPVDAMILGEEREQLQHLGARQHACD